MAPISHQQRTTTVLSVICCIIFLGLSDVTCEDNSPRLVTTIRNITVAEGQTAVLPCKVVDLGRHKVKVVWTDQWGTVLTFNEASVVDDRRIRMSNEEVPSDGGGHHYRGRRWKELPTKLQEGSFTNRTVWNLHFGKIKLSDQGEYTCTVNTQPKMTHTIKLNVVAPPSIPAPERAQVITVGEGEMVQLTCNATGTPDPTVTWSHPARSPETYFRRSYSNRRHSDRESCSETTRVGSMGETLIIRNITRYCSGRYYCEASNGVPPSATRAFDVKVKFEPNVHLTNDFIRQSVGKDTILECEVTGYPQTSVFWSFKDQNIVSSEKYTLDIPTEDDESRLTLNLVVKDIQEEDYGFYTCSASNALGTAQRTMELRQMSQTGWLHIEGSPTTTTPSTADSRDLKSPNGRSKHGRDEAIQNYSQMPKGRAGVGHTRDSTISADGRYNQKHTRPEASLHRNGENSASTLLTSQHRIFTSVISLCLLAWRTFDYQ